MIENLTKREVEVLALIGQGLSTAQIAAKLHRSPKTIEKHRNALGKKLSVSNRVELARIAIQAGLVASPVLNHDATAKVIAGLRKQVDQNKAAHHALLSIDAGTSFTVGHDFFESLVQHLSEALGVKYAFMGEVDDKNNLDLHIVCAYCDGEFQESMTCHARSKLCECVLRNGVTHRIDNRIDCCVDSCYSITDATSYLGVPLIDSSNQVIGALLVLHAETINTQCEPELIMRIFASRASAELQRLRVERTLHEGEEKYRGLFNESLAAVYVFDTNKRFIDVNPAGLDLLGYSRKELLQMHIKDVDADPDEVLHAHNQLLSGERIIGFEHLLKRKDGKIITVLNNSKPITNKDGVTTGLLSTIIEITEQKRIQEKLVRSRLQLEEILAERTDTLAESNERFQSIVEDMPGIVFSYDQYQDGHRKVNFIGSGYEDLFNHDLRDLLSGDIDRFFLLVHPNDIALFQSTADACVVSGKQFTIEYRIRDGRDGLRWLHTFARSTQLADGVIRWRGILTDVTDRKQMEHQLRTQAETEHMLLRELNHRVGNNLSSLRTLIDLTAQNSRDIRSYADTLSNRVKAMETAHLLLSGRKWSGVTFSTIVIALQPPGCPGTINLAGPDVMIPPRHSQKFAMAINELMTNSIKYGSLGAEGGVVSVEWEIYENAVGQSHIRIKWTESNGPRITETPVPSTGTNLITGLIQYDLRGVVKYQYPPTGVEHEIIVSLVDYTSKNGLPNS